jgi:hypothetical protein
MTREQHLAFCEKCTNKKMDDASEIVCKITDEKANFVNECKDFTIDTSMTNQFIENTVSFDELALSEKELLKLKEEQNLKNGLAGSILVGLLGSVIWAAITVATNYQIGYMAIAIGAGVGYTMRYLGKGIDQIFGISGAIIAVLSCLLGNFFSLVGFYAQGEGVGIFETLNTIDYSLVPGVMSETFSMMDLFFYGIAGYEGYKFAFRNLANEAEVSSN